MTGFQVFQSDGPIIATAIHAGHDMRPDTLSGISLPESDRLREEDPFTDQLADIGTTRVEVASSRFEVDLNRPRESCIYLTPEDAWGLEVWAQGQPTAEAIKRSLASYDAFYEAMHELLTRTISRHGGVIVLDIHSYNHRRGGPGTDAADEASNPEINVGTGTLDREVWSPVVDVFLEGMRSAGFDARENVKFKGGAFSGWVHREFPGKGCVLAVEFKKTFMDEWTGIPDPVLMERAAQALRAMVPGLEAALGGIVQGGPE